MEQTHSPEVVCVCVCVCIYVSWWRNFPPLMEPEGSLLYSNETPTVSYSGSLQSCIRQVILFLQDPF